MPAPNNHPLTDEHCKCLDRVLAAIPDQLALAEACKDCGWPADDYIAILKQQQEMAAKAKATFFPMRP